MIQIPRTKDFYSHYEKNNGSDTCIVCGRILATENVHSVQTWYGSEIVSKEEAIKLTKTNPNGDSGAFLVGPDCLKRNPQIKPYIQK